MKDSGVFSIWQVRRRMSGQNHARPKSVYTLRTAPQIGSLSPASWERRLGRSIPRSRSEGRNDTFPPTLCMPTIRVDLGRDEGAKDHWSIESLPRVMLLTGTKRLHQFARRRLSSRDASHRDLAGIHVRLSGFFRCPITRVHHGLSTG